MSINFFVNSQYYFQIENIIPHTFRLSCGFASSFARAFWCVALCDDDIVRSQDFVNYNKKKKKIATVRNQKVKSSTVHRPPGRRASRVKRAPKRFAINVRGTETDVGSTRRRRLFDPKRLPR